MLMPELKRVLKGEAHALPITSIPYAQFLGLALHRADDGGLMLAMPYSEALIGSPKPPRLHGGTIGALLEFAGSIAVTRAAHEEAGIALGSFPKPIGITIEYMRGGAPQDIFASAEVLRLGRRVANVTAKAWQEDDSRINAAATMHFLMPDAQA
ncbi:MAG: PaaI family thioesterase [Pseudomonadota bacterium]